MTKEEMINKLHRYGYDMKVLGSFDSKGLKNLMNETTKDDPIG